MYVYIFSSSRCQVCRERERYLWLCARRQSEDCHSERRDEIADVKRV